MSKVRAIIIGSLIWILGSSFYTASYFLPFLDDLELQANLVLAISIVPNAWLGARLYYRSGANMHGLKLGVIVLITSITLDAIITVPFLILPNGGSYQLFFGAPAFWLIAIEFLLIVFGYWLIKVKQHVKLLITKNIF